MTNLQRGDIFLAIAHVEDGIAQLPDSDAPLVSALRGMLVAAVLTGRHIITEATEARPLAAIELALDCGGDLAAHEPALDKAPVRELAEAWEPAHAATDC